MYLLVAWLFVRANKGNSLTQSPLLALEHKVSLWCCFCSKMFSMRRVTSPTQSPPPFLSWARDQAMLELPIRAKGLEIMA